MAERPSTCKRTPCRRTARSRRCRDRSNRDPPRAASCSRSTGRVPLATEADALALWKQIAPTGDDWDAKLDEVPDAAARPLAIALLDGGNFTCMSRAGRATARRRSSMIPPPHRRARRSVPAPAARAVVDRSARARSAAHRMRCARSSRSRRPSRSSSRPRSSAVPELDQDARLELLAIAWQAGQHGSGQRPGRRARRAAHDRRPSTSTTSTARSRSLSAEGHRAVFLARGHRRAARHREARDQAIDRGRRRRHRADAQRRAAPDLQTALVTATQSRGLRRRGGRGARARAARRPPLRAASGRALASRRR